MTKLRVLDLFSGIGGFSLGLERTGGFSTVAFCEIDPFCRRVLAKHWPNVRQFEDVTKMKGEDVGPVDVICGGFPCQDVSSMGKRAGLAGERSGLWTHFARLIGEIRPDLVIVENVADLLGLGLGDVLGDLASIRYDAEWHCIPAGYVGAPHERDRVWIIAYPSEESRFHESYFGEAAQRLRDDCNFWRTNPWPETTSPVCRVDDGVPFRVERTESLGNAVVPQIPEIIGRAILAAVAANKIRAALTEPT